MAGFQKHLKEATLRCRLCSFSSCLIPAGPESHPRLAAAHTAQHHPDCEPDEVGQEGRRWCLSASSSWV